MLATCRIARHILSDACFMSFSTMLRRVPPSIKILDGGLGTELERAEGCDLLEHPLWSARLLIDNPTAIKEAHKRFLLAGSNAVITASYQASIDGFMTHFNISREESKRLIQLSIDVANDAISEVKSIPENKDKEYYVAASVAPYGAMLHDMSEYSGNYVDNMSVEELKEWHRDRISILLEKNPDFLAIETMPALKEVVAILELLKEFPNARAWVTFTCQDTKTTFHSDSFADAIKTISENPQVSSLGINCSHPDNILALINSVKDILPPGKSIIIYPNSGLKFSNGRWIPEEHPRDLSEYVHDWLDTGVVEWIGGCCKTFPEDIAKISNAVKSWKSSV